MSTPHVLLSLALPIKEYIYTGNIYIVVYISVSNMKKMIQERWWYLPMIGHTRKTMYLKKIKYEKKKVPKSICNLINKFFLTLVALMHFNQVSINLINNPKHDSLSMWMLRVRYMKKKKYEGKSYPKYISSMNWTWLVAAWNTAL